MKKIFLFILFVLVMLILWLLRVQIKDTAFEFKKMQLPQEQPVVQNADPAAQNTASSIKDKEPTGNVAAQTETVAEQTKKAEEKTIADGINLPVPFMVQAPYANWDSVHEEACEEASIIMANAYATGAPPAGRPWDADSAENEIQKLVAWQKEMFGYFEDTTVSEVATIAREYFELKNVSIVENPTAQGLKDFLSQGFIIVMPAYGKALNNPYFTNGGPDYHMLLIKGYTKDGKFITNDPGTKRGNNFVYSPDVLLGAIHDWEPGNVQNSAKRILVIGK